MAWTTPRTWSDGELVTASMMNAHVRDNENALARFIGKTADESVVSSTVFQDDDHLLFAMGANENWFCGGILWHECANAGVHFKVAFTVPAGGDYHLNSQGLDTGGVNFVQVQHRSVADAGTYFTGSTGNATQFFGVVQTAGTAGNFRVQWAQQISNAAAVILKKGSAMWFQRVQ
jgi:hypothetical protein